MMKEKVAEGLRTQNLRMPKFYLRLKLHKKGNPGGPVVSSVNCHTSNISKYVDYYLQPIVKDNHRMSKGHKIFYSKT